jgi:hypothetical protein
LFRQVLGTLLIANLFILNIYYVPKTWSNWTKNAAFYVVRIVTLITWLYSSYNQLCKGLARNNQQQRFNKGCKFLLLIRTGWIIIYLHSYKLLKGTERVKYK